MVRGARFPGGRHWWLTTVSGSAKGIIGAHNDASNIENWITSTTPTLVILEKVCPDLLHRVVWHFLPAIDFTDTIAVGVHHFHHAASRARLHQAGIPLLLPSHLHLA